MNNFTLPKLITIVVVMVFLAIPFSTFAQNHAKNYLIAGSFSREGSAKKMINTIRENGNEASYLRYHYSDGKIVHYVYLFASNSQNEIKQKVSTYKSGNSFKNLWILEPKGKMTILSKEALAETTNTAPANTIAGEAKEEQVTTEPTINEANKRGEYMAIFQMWDAEKQKPVSSRLTITHSNKSLRKRIVNNDQLINFKAADLHATSMAFGYKEATTNLNLHELLADSAKMSMRGDTVIIDWPLQQIKRGDIQIMYNVIFHPDAAVMKSDSKQEMNTLLSLLADNENMKVMIHGHTNGVHFGKIIRVVKDGNLFSLTPENKTKMGSAKELSKLRAETIQGYLLKNGVAKNRMEIKGWGGSKMIYDKDDIQAKKNARVEIEILED